MDCYIPNLVLYLIPIIVKSYLPVRMKDRYSTWLSTFEEMTYIYYVTLWTKLLQRYKKLLRVCPHHGLPRWLQIQIFYNGLNSSTKSMVDASSGSILLKNKKKEVFRGALRTRKKGRRGVNMKASSEDEGKKRHLG